MAKATPAVGYVRMSTGKQDASPERQRGEIESFASENGYSIVSWYSDLAISGDRTDKRVGFQRMIADGSCGRFDAIICWDQDRFGRFDMLEAGRWIHPLREAGVHLATVTDGKVDWTDMAGRLVYSVKQEGKNRFLHDLSNNVTSTQRKKAEAGLWTFGNPPYGYTVGSDQRLYPDPTTAPIVKELFDKYASGWSLRSLVDHLDDRGFKSIRGKRWSVAAMADLLRNSHYLGRLICNRSSSSKYQHGVVNGARKALPQSEWIVVTDSHEPLVPQSLFDTVQDRLTSNRRNTGPKKMNGEFALKQMLKCGKCGAPMHGWFDKKSGKRKYICYSYLQSAEACERFVVNEQDVLAAVLKVVREQVFDRFTDADIEAIKNRMREILEGEKAGGEIVEGHLGQVRGQIEQARRRLCEVPADMVEHVVARIRDLEDQESRLADQAERMNQPVPKQVELVEKRIRAALAWIDELDAIVGTDYDPLRVREMLRQFVVSVDCHVERVPLGKRKHRSVLTGGEVAFRMEGLPVELSRAIFKVSSSRAGQN